MVEFEHFLEAQDGHYDQAMAEMRAGRKESHWIWFIFPQHRGLGTSPVSRRFALTVDEAEDYLDHPILASRLQECAAVVLRMDQSPSEVFGGLDAMKLRSSMTLFALVSAPNSIFRQVLAKHWNGKADERTLALAGG